MNALRKTALLAGLALVATVANAAVDEDMKALATKSGCQCLPAEADAKHGDAAVVCAPQEAELVGDPGSDRGVVVHRPRCTQWNDGVIAERIGEHDSHVGSGEPILRHDLKRLDFEAPAAESFADVAE